MSNECVASKNVSQPGNGYLYLQVRKEHTTCGTTTVEDTGGTDRVKSQPMASRGIPALRTLTGLSNGVPTFPGLRPKVGDARKVAACRIGPRSGTCRAQMLTRSTTMEGLETLGQACYHLHPPPGSEGPGGCLSSSYAGWHTYASEWEPGAVKYFYDGAQVGQINSEAVNGTPQYLVADMVPPGCCGQPLVVPDEMVVKYVRVWQHPPPEVYSQTPHNVTRETAELASQIRPGAYEASYFFEYGTTTGYGSRVPVSSEEHLPSSESWSNVYVPVGGLKSCTTYDFRVVAKNVFGGVDGPDRGTDNAVQARECRYVGTLLA